VVATILIQFLIVITGWVTGWSAFADDQEVPNSLTYASLLTAEYVDAIMCGTLIVALVITFLTTFVWPAYKHNRVKAHDWPPTLARPPRGSAGPTKVEANGKHIGYSYTPPQTGLQPPRTCRYFFFDTFLNVFPQIKVGADPTHRWPDPPAECIAMQSKRAQVALAHDGQDTAYDKGDKKETTDTMSA